MVTHPSGGNQDVYKRQGELSRIVQVVTSASESVQLLLEVALTVSANEVEPAYFFKS